MRDSVDGEINSILASPLRVLCSFDDSVRSRQHVRRDREADLLGGFKINDGEKYALGVTADHW